MITPAVIPSQRARWDSWKAANHPYYQQAKREADKNGTTNERYGDRGRWPAEFCQMSGDPVYAQKAYETTKRISQNWTPGSLGAGNDLREHGVEHAVMLSWVAAHLTPSQVAEWKTWLISCADFSMSANLRLNDTDQTTGTFFFWANVDRFCGTDYLTRQKAKDAYEAIKKFMSYGEGGGYPVMGDYEWGDLTLLFQGAEFAGIEKFPEVAAFRDAVAKAVMQWTTSDLKDSFECGDDQSPNQITTHVREDLLAYLGHFQPMVRAHEMDVRQALNWPDGAPMYARYFYWVNTDAPAADWRSFVGTWLVNPKMGRVYHKTGWMKTDAGLFIYMPPLSNGVGGHDHIYGWFNHKRWRDGEEWLKDSPIGYSGHRALGNHTVICGLPASGEIGRLTAAQQIGRLVYVSGINAGLNTNSVYYSPPGTHRHEQSPTNIYVPGWRALVTIERLHIDDPKTLPILPGSAVMSITRYSATLQAIINSSPLIRSYHHSQTAEPQIQDGVITNGLLRIRPLYPATLTVVNMAADGVNYGTLHSRERKYYTMVDPLNQVPGFRTLTTFEDRVDGDCSCFVTQVSPDVQLTHLTKPGERSIKVYSSTKPSPKLMTTRSGSNAVYDQSKADGIIEARRVTVDPAWADPDSDVYVEQPDGLVQLNPSVEPLSEIELLKKELELTKAELMAVKENLSTALALIAELRTTVESLQTELNTTIADRNSAQARALAVEEKVQQIKIILG